MAGKIAFENVSTQHDLVPFMETDYFTKGQIILSMSMHI
jgi:hypothetical protein